jgi:hypothetical protein
METKQHVHAATENVNGQSILKPESCFLQDNNRPLISDNQAFSSILLAELANNKIDFELYWRADRHAEVRVWIGGPGLHKRDVERYFTDAVRRQVDRMTRSAHIPTNSNLAPNSNLLAVLAGNTGGCPLQLLKSGNDETAKNMLQQYTLPKQCTHFLVFGIFVGIFVLL